MCPGTERDALRVVRFGASVCVCVREEGGRKTADAVRCAEETEIKRA